jgi:hypothetical protein
MNNEPRPAKKGRGLRGIVTVGAEKIDRGIQTGLQAFAEVKKTMRRVSEEPEGKWKQNSLICSERDTIASMDKTLKQIYQVLTNVANHLPTSTTKGENTDDGATSESPQLS